MAPGLGHFDWPPIISTLKDVGYVGAIAVEFCPPLDRTPANEYPNSVENNPEGVSESELKFLEDHGSSVFSSDFYEMHVAKSAETLLPLIG
jgi:sugar phosphate isomerase/epimerase